MVEKKRLNKILEQFKTRKIGVLGDMMLDEYIIGKVDRISPEAPVPIVNVQSESFVLGGAANVVNNLSSLGVDVYTYSVIGDDENGRKLKKILQQKGVNVSGVLEDKDRPTIVKKRIIAHNQQLLRLDWEDKKEIVQYLEDQILENLKQTIDELDGIILSDYDKGVLTSRMSREVIKLAKKKGKILIVDPKPKNMLNYIGATSMTPNQKEAMECIDADSFNSEIEFEKNIEKLKLKLKLENLLVTRSEKGMTLVEKNLIETIPTVAQEVYDVTGAGDTVIAVYTLALTCNASLLEAAKIANSAAGIVVGRMGTSVVTKDELINFYEELYVESRE